MKSLLTTFLLLAALLACSIVTPVTAWWCTGHMAVAEVARLLLIKDGKTDVVNKLNEIMISFDASGPWPKSPDAVQVACWADDIKGNTAAMNTWHYIDQPYNPQHMTLPADLAGPSNVVIQINNFYKALKTSPNNWERNFAVAWLIHLIGDIHQPLHATTLYDSTFPAGAGDIGGNFFHVKLDGKDTTLHKYWDSACGTLATDFPRPLNTTDQASLTSLAQGYIDVYGPQLSTAMKTVYDPAKMANESYAIAVDLVYDNNNLKPYDALTEEYQDACVDAAESQITLAGYRLANQLAYLL